MPSSLLTGIIGSWQMEGGSSDPVNGNDGVDTSISYNTSYGKILKGADFSSNNSQIYIDDSANQLDAGSGERSLFVWIYYNNVAADNIAVKHNTPPGSPPDEYQLKVTPGPMRFTAEALGASVTGTTIVSTGTWYHVGLVVSEFNYLELWVNGVREASTMAGVNNFQYQPFNLEFGDNSASAGSLTAQFYLDEVLLYDRVLSGAEIGELYNSGNGFPYPFPATLIADTQSYSLTGVNTGLLQGHVLSASTGSFSLNGIDTGLLRGYPLTATRTTFSLTGITTALVKGFPLRADPGTFTLTGFDTGLLSARSIAAALGTFSFSGISVGLYKGYAITTFDDLLYSLVAYWKNDDNTGTTTTDSTQRGHDGVLSGISTPSWTAGKIRNAIRFNGSPGGAGSSYVAVSTSDDWTFGTGPFTIAFWTKVQNSSAFLTWLDTGYALGSGILIEYSLSSPPNSILIYLNGIGVSVLTSPVGFPLQDGSYHYVVVSRDGGGALQILVDNVQIGFNPSVFNDILNSGNDITIGRYPGENLDGEMDEMAIYLRALDTPETDRLYNSGAGMSYSDMLTPAFLFSLSDSGLLVGRAVVADLGAFSETGNTANLLKGYKLTADLGTFSETGNTTGLTVSRQIASNLGTFSFTGNNAGLVWAAKITADLGTFSFTANDVSLTKGYLVGAGIGSFSLSGIDTPLIKYSILSADVDNMALTGYDANTIKTGSISVSTGNFIFIGNPASPTYSKTLVASSGSFSVTTNDVNTGRTYIIRPGNGWFTLYRERGGPYGDVVGLYRGFYIAPEQSNFSFTGVSSNFSRNYNITAANGSALLSGNLIDFSKTNLLSADSVSYLSAYTGVNLARSRIMSLTAASFSLTLQGIENLRTFYLSLSSTNFTKEMINAACISSRRIPSDTAQSYVLSTFSIGFKRTLTIPASTQSYSLDGQNIFLLKGNVLALDRGSFSEQGINLNFKYGYAILSDVGSFLMTGQDIALNLYHNKLISADTLDLILSGQDTLFPKVSKLLVSSKSLNLIGSQATLRTKTKYGLLRQWDGERWARLPSTIIGSDVKYWDGTKWVPLK